MRTKISSSVLAVVAVATAFGLAGCGDDAKKDTKSYGSEPLGSSKSVVVNSQSKFDADQQAVIDTLVAFGDATESKDYAKICNEIFSEGARQLGGDQCEKTLVKSGKKIKSFEIEVSKVDVGADGKSATVESITKTNGKAQPTPFSLSKDGSGNWHVEILGQ